MLSTKGLGQSFTVNLMAVQKRNKFLIECIDVAFKVGGEEHDCPRPIARAIRSDAGSSGASARVGSSAQGVNFIYGAQERLERFERT